MRACMAPTRSLAAWMRLCVAVGMAAPALTAAHPALWSARVDEHNGLPVISRGGAGVLTSTFAFWRKDWKWTETETTLEVVGPYRYEVRGRNRDLRLALTASISRIGDTSLQWEILLAPQAATPDAVGGGIAFRFDPDAFDSGMGEPSLLAGNRGWSWGRPGGTRIEMRFEPAPASVQFEGGRKAEIRAYFYAGSVPQGERRFAATLSVAGDVAVVPTLAERHGPVRLQNWFVGTADRLDAPADLSFLNAQERPAGRRGFVRAVGERLVFEDGTPARFWGTNLSAYALFRTPPDDVRRQAHRLSRLGFNLVRLHHHDSPWVEPNIFGDRNAPDTSSLDPRALERLDWWIKCLKDEGIYVWLDLHVQRGLKRADGVEGFEEIAQGRAVAQLKGFNYVNASIRDAMKRFNAAYLEHRNRYTGLRYMEEPAIVAVTLTNENDLTHHFGNALLPDKGVPLHSQRFVALAREFARKHGLPVEATWRTWEPGPAKLFLNDLERRFNADMIAHLRALGSRALVATTSFWGNSPLSSLPALTSGDVVAAHAYGGAGELERNPLYAPTMVHWLAAAQVAGKPVVVTEWNVEPFPVPDRHTIPLYLAAATSLQGWSAVLHYAYGQDALGAAARPSAWNGFNDPAMLATFPAAALLFRRGDVRRADRIYAYAPSREELFYRRVSPANSAALRTAAELGRLVIVLPRVSELPWLSASVPPEGAISFTDPDQPLLAPDAQEATSATGELRRNWASGTFTIDTPRTQAASGWIGGSEVRLSDVTLALGIPSAAVAVQSKDGLPIRQSKDILISIGVRSVPRTARETPFYTEPVQGRLIVRAPPGLHVYALGGRGVAPPAIEVPYVGGRYVIDLEHFAGAHWLALR